MSIFRLQVTLIALAVALPAAAEPPVHWAPQSVTAAVAKGEVRDIRVVLNAVEPLTDIVIRVVPELAPYVTVSPAALSSVAAGQSVELHLTVRAAPDAPEGLFRGTLQVRQRVARGQGRVFPRPLPVTVTVQTRELVEGIDENSNGVWDDIDRYIDTTYSTAPPSDRAAMRQFSRALQGALLNAADQALSLRYALESDRATECLYALRPSDARRVLEDIKSATLNNRARSRAFLMWSEQSAGQVFRAKPKSQRATSCIPE
jgi:hypothetical protein